VVEPHHVRRERVIREPDQPAISELELMQIREIPSRERGIDRHRELLKGVQPPNSATTTASARGAGVIAPASDG
jgi:hypothetical protein